MKLIGFNFNKVNAEKLSDSYKGVKLNTKIEILDVINIESTFLKEESIVKVRFLYTIEYNPDLAKIEIGGEILLNTDKKQAKEIVESWKDKKISEDIRILIFNLILRKANLKALELEELLTLPLHISMPSLQKSKKQ